jgi:cytochrome oxidase Cu insertion factor (SCO1/SenC/PrrC family)
MKSRILILLFAVVTAFAPSLLKAADSAPAPVARSTPVGTGDRAPDFTLEDQNGRKHTLSAELKSRPVVLVFYRGNW